MEILGKLIRYLRKAYPPGDFSQDSIFNRGCMTHWIYSEKLNQIIVIKFPVREHYISKELARNYLNASRKTIEDNFAPSTLRNAYVLNILISDKLTKSCFDLVTSGSYQNMDMLFNPKTKRMNDKEILHTILGALATKFRNWSNQIKKSCSKTRSEYRKTSKGTIRMDKRIEPYGKVKEKMKDLERAADILESVSRKYEKGDGKCQGGS